MAIDRALRSATPENTAISVCTNAGRQPPVDGAPLVDSGLWEHWRPKALVTVVVPVYNAREELRRCLESVVKNTTMPANLLLIDDASLDRRVAPVLAEFGSHSNVTVLENHQNLGFVGTVNRGFEIADGDVVLLNADTIVPPRWLESLTQTAYRDPTTATVTPLSNNAGAFSAPDVGYNAPPGGVDWDTVGRLVARCSQHLYPSAPTGNGFCMYIKRVVLDAVGSFDHDAFGRGYGEENDFCMRALAHGWRHVVDDAVYVFHEQGASFGAEREQLIAGARAILDERYPDYGDKVRAFMQSERTLKARSNVGEPLSVLRSRSRRAPIRLLYVIHQGSGGTPQTNLDLMQAIQASYEPYLLTSDSKSYTLYRLEVDELVEVEQHRFSPPIEITDIHRRDVETVVSQILERFRIELVHVRHLIRNSFDPIAAAVRRLVPVVVSLHDFYMVCPTVHLLDDEDRYCGGTCTDGQGVCRSPSPWVDRAPHLKHGWVRSWQAGVSEILSSVDAIVTTTDSARSVYTSVYPNTSIDVIEHGRDLVQQPHAELPDGRGKIRIVVLGNLQVHKGANYIRELIEADTEGVLEFHFLGRVPNEFQDLGFQHGLYDRSDLGRRLAEIRPNFSGLFSVWPETYSHTLTESWEAGLPVIAMDLGALGERIRKHGGGWLVDPTDPEAALSVIMAAREPDEYRRVVDSIDVGGLPSVQNMAEAYDRLYQRVLYRRRSFRGAAGARPTHVEGHLVRSGENFPGSAHVRVLRRFLHPSMDSEVRFSLASPADAADGHQPDLVLVQRTAIPGESIDEFFARANSIGARVVFDIDDDLLSPPEDTDSRVPYDETVGAVRECIRRADLVTVSTEPLKERFAPIAEGRVIVVPNQLDERLWRVDRDVPIEHAGQGLRLVYVGSMTHGSDLQRVRDAIERLRASGVEVSLDVVGGERPGPGQDWYRRVQIPRTAYPHFVPWLQEQASHWDVALAPLENTYFNEAKSDVKFLEYAALGIPGVYSSVGPYATSVRHGETGLLVSSEDDWADQIMTLVEQPDFRSTIARAARDQVLESRTIDRANHVIRDVLVELATVDFEEGR